jgi:hypothetical protein
MNRPRMEDRGWFARHKQVFLKVAIFALFVLSADAQSVSRQAAISGGAGNGRCTIEVNVDGAAEVEVFGNTGTLRTLSGRPAFWRRFECNSPMPREPVDFRFLRIDGRGQVRLLQDPRGSGGVATIRINDPKGGREGYTFDLRWRGRFRPPAPAPPLPGNGPWEGGSSMQTAIRTCQSSVTDRLNRRGYQYVNFEQTVPYNQPRPDDRVTGSVTGTRGFGTTRFEFSCSADFRSGTVRSVGVRRR